MRLHPIFTGGVSLLTAIAVAASVVAFSIVYGILWRPLPYPDADRLVVLWQVRQGEQGQVSYPDFADVAGASVFDGAAAIAGGRGSLRIGEAIERVNMIEMEPQGYSMLGARPALGRLLEPGDSGKSHVLVSHRLWRGSLASDPAVVGRSLWISGRTYTVVGVLQPRFDFELPIAPMLRLEKQDLWTIFDRTTPFVARRDVTTYEALLRLAPGVTLDQARAAVEATGRRLAASHPATNADRGLRLAPLRDEIVAPVRRPLLLVALASAVTLLIALVNVAMLALMRTTARAREMVIRQALGAGSLRLHRQVLTESTWVTVAGAVAGFLAARPILNAIVASEALRIPRSDAIRLDGAAVLYATAIALLIVAVLTMMPLRLSDGAVTLRAGARVAGRRLRASRRFAVAAELAVALVLCSAGALLGLSVARLFAMDPGFDPRGALGVRVSAYAARYPASPDVQRFFSAVVENLESIPDVLSAAAGSSLPLSGQTSGTAVVAEGQPVSTSARLTAGWQFVTPGYFETIGMRVRDGRDFTPDDNRHEGHVTVINEDLARRLFPGQSAVGRRIGVGGGETAGHWHEIVGVVGDVRHQALDAALAPRVYDLFGEHWGRTLYVVARSRTSEAAPLISPVRRAIAALDAEAPVFDAATMTTLVGRSAAPRRIAALVAAGLAATAVLLALVGVYAVMAASVAERTTEIGIRAALGAAPSDLLVLIAREGAATAMAGATAGLGASVAAGRLIHAQLFGVRPSDIALVITLSCLLLVVAGVAATLPAARRAASADPLTAMRVE